MREADSNPNAQVPTRFISLRYKLFLPFLLLTLALISAAIWGVFLLADRSFKNSADERLAATGEVLYKEFKRQEQILQTYAVIMQQFQNLSERVQNSGEIALLQDRLYNTLEEADISTAFYPADIRGLIESESLVALFEHVRRSERARFRYSSEFGDAAMLMVASPVVEGGEVTQVLLLKTEMGDTFLRNTLPMKDIKATLFDINGLVMARSSSDASSIKLTPEQVSAIGSGQPLYLDYESAYGAERLLFTMIPLGNSDYVMLSLQASLNASADIQNETILTMIVAMCAVVLLCTIFYFRRISVVTSPARELLNAAQTISRGNLGYRINEISDDELGQLAVTFNQMADQIELSYQERASKDIETALARQENKSRLILEKRERERDRLNDELSVIQRETTALYQLNQAMTAAIDLGALFDRILQVLNEILACDHIVLLAHNLGESTLEVVRTAGLDVDLLKEIRFTFNQGITGEAAQSQRMIYVKNLDEENRRLSYHGQIVTRGSMISAPLVVKGRLVGVLNLHKKQVDAFNASEQKLIQAVANQTAVAIDNAQLHEKTRELSSTDELTGLANRRHFQDILKREIAQARRFSTIFSIIMCDIDGFRQLKSSLGNIHSDAMLRQVGQSLLKNTRGIDLVSRFGSDQFIILLPKTDKKGGVAAAEKLRMRISSEDIASQIDSDLQFNLTLSFGVTEFPCDSKNIYELLNLADRALYAAKKEGANRTVAWEGPAQAPE